MYEFQRIDVILRRVVRALEKEERRRKRMEKQVANAIPALEALAAGGDETAAALLAEARGALADPQWPPLGSIIEVKR